MNPMTDPQIQDRVAAIFGGNHVPGRDQDKGQTEDTNAPNDEEFEDTDNPEAEFAADPDSPDPNEIERKEEAADRLRQADYTRKTMALAEEKKAIAAERAEFAEMRQFRDELASNESLRAEVVAAWQRNQRAEGQATSSESVALRQIAARLNAMEQESAAQREDRFVARLDAEQRSIAQEFGMTVEEVQAFTADLIKADWLGFSTPPDAINDILGGRVARARVKTSRLEGQKDLVKQITTGRRAPSVVPSGKTPAKRELSESDVAKMSDREFQAFIRKETAGKS